MFYCGFDGGASKTEVCVIDEKGTVVKTATFGPINPNGASLETVKSTLADCVYFMKSVCEIENYGGLVVGISGASNKEATKIIESTIRECGYTGKLSLKGDQEIALKGAIDGAGAILIAGTGSICFGIDQNGKNFRCGGCGYLIDDDGSGYSIGIEILKAVTRAEDGRGEETLLKSLVFEKLEVENQTGLLTWLYAKTTEKSHIAELAPLLLTAIEKGDKIAKSIAQKAAKDLVTLVTSAFKKVNLSQGEVAQVGSIFKHFDIIKTQFKELLKAQLPNVKIVEPRHTPSYGAAILAKEI